LDCLLPALDTLAFGVAVLETELGIVYANAAARALLLRAGCALDAGALRPRGADRAAWVDALDQVCSHQRRRLLELGGGDTRQFVALTPANWHGIGVAVVTFGRFELCGALELQLFSTFHGLSGAESRVLAKLACGLRAAEIARVHGVALSTVATQVTAIRAKTCCASVRELLDELGRLPPLRSAVSA
jgi:DNA-binding CsgD family transcriptional regulator